MSNARPADPYNLCQFTFANGRMCGLPAHPKHDGLCLNHARLKCFRQRPREEDLSRELCSPAGDDYITQIDINHVLGKLFNALAANRISIKRATGLAYIAQLLLQSQSGAKQEARRWTQDLPTYKTLLKLKYPKGHPNHPDTPEEEAQIDAEDLIPAGTTLPS
jgi:hypothetical protein